MNKVHFLPVCLALLACLAAGLGLAAGARADLQALETLLNPAGAVYEINPDQQGVLWISDFGAGQVWSVDPEGGFYEAYQVTGSPTDARHDGSYLWWADGESNILGQVSTSDGAFTNWEVPGAEGFYGTALDAEGRFWAIGYESGPPLPSGYPGPRPG